MNNDYNGGEFIFPEKDFELVPEPGSLLIFPGTKDFEHGVNPVKDGPIRYVMPGFIKVPNFYENNKY